jgi:GNAT superfamily N-acetyltransferase
MTPHPFKIEAGYLPGSIGRMVAVQAEVYSNMFGEGLDFEVQRARDIAKFFSDYKPQRDDCWFAVLEDDIVGSIIADGREGAGESAELRWFILDPKARGLGFGKRLLQAALDFCQIHYKHVHLVTHPKLETAKQLYEQSGFRFTGEYIYKSNNVSTMLQAFEKNFAKPDIFHHPQSQYYKEGLE